MPRKKSLEGMETRFATVICATGRLSKQHSQIWLIRRKTDDTYFTATTPIIRKHGEMLGAPYIYHRTPEIPPQKDGKYHPKIRIQGKTYSLGYYDSHAEALKEYLSCRDDYYFCNHQPPKDHHANVIDKWVKKYQIALSHHNGRKDRTLPALIFKKRNKYRFQITLLGVHYSKTFKMLSDALAYRNNFLKKHGISVPND